MTTAPAAVSTALQLSNVRKVYTMGDGSDVVALDHATLVVDDGEIVSLLGPSGSGKTTLLNLLAGIDRPDAGTVSVGGQDVGGTRASKLARWRARTVGYIFQRAHLVPVLTAYENVELPLWLQKLSRADRHRRVELAQGEAVDEPVARPAMAGGAVDELGGERSVALGEAAAGQQPGQHQVGVGAVLLDADQRLDGDAAGVGPRHGAASPRRSPALTSPRHFPIPNGS